MSELGESTSDGMDWEPIKQRIQDADVEVALEAAKELRERIEIVHSTEFPRMLSAILPVFSTVLSHLVRPNADTTSTQHKVRNNILEVLSRLPNNEVLRPHAPQILTIAMDVLLNDYEENALLASRIVFDIHKNYRQIPQDQVQPYLDFVLGAYRSLSSAVETNFQFTAEQNPLVAATPAPSKADGDAMDAVKPEETPSAQGNAEQQPTHTPPANICSPAAGIPATPPVRLAPKSNLSFRVLTECPLTVMLLFQLHPKFLKANIQTMITLMIEALALRAPPLLPLPSQAAESGLKRLHASRTRELVAGQVKTLSFLTQFLKSFADQLKPYEDRIANNVVSLMTICPHESIGTRRELLHATRHILATDFRKGLFRHVDALLDERVLMGSHPKQCDTAVLWPLGYSTLADLVHHARSLLSTKQLSRVVYIFSRVIHDSSLNLQLAIQTTAIRLLLNLVDIIFHNKDPDPQLGRDLLSSILDTLVRKLGVLVDYIPIVEKAEQQRKAEMSELDAAVAWVKKQKSADDVRGGGLKPEDYTQGRNEASEVPSNKMEVDDVREGRKGADGSSKSGAKSESTTLGGVNNSIKFWELDETSNVTDTLQDVQTMVRSIVVGLKTVIWCINNYCHQREKDKGRETLPAGSNEELSSAMQKLTNWERGLVDKFITYALASFKVFKEVSRENTGSALQPKSESFLVASQYRDALTYFAATFTVLDSYNFRRTIGTRIDILLGAIVEDHHVMVIPRHLLGSNQKASFVFAGVLLSFLVERMEEMSWNDSDDFVFLEPRVDADYTDASLPMDTIKKAFARVEDKSTERKKRAEAILELFERVLKSLASFPDNESALRPHLRGIVATCLRSTVEQCQAWPDNYCSLLRLTFRAISAGKFEESYKELLPILPTILNGLYRVLLATNDANLRHVIIELCLTVPARLSSLLPHMPLLLRMIIKSLTSEAGDLVNLGLRTLEFWVDNLNPDFLYPILAKQTQCLTELMTALSTHLRPAPYPYGLLTLRLLGKLGGKNRCFLRESLDVISGAPLSRKGMTLSLPCAWSRDKGLEYRGDEMIVDASEEDPGEKGKDAASDDHHIPLPIEEAVEILRLIALCSKDETTLEEQKNIDDEDVQVQTPLKWEAYGELRKLWADRVDVAGYCDDVVEQTKTNQARAAFSVLRSALAMILDIKDISSAESTEPRSEHKLSSGRAEDEDLSRGLVLESAFNSSDQTVTTDKLKTICKGIIYASAIERIEGEAGALVRGFALHFFLLVTTLREHISRSDAYGSPIPGLYFDDGMAVGENDANARQDDGVKAVVVDSNPLGCFLLSGPFVGKANPFVFNEAIAEILSESAFSSSSQKACLELIKCLLLICTVPIEDKAGVNQESLSEPQRKCRPACDIIFESLINALCRTSHSSMWNLRSGLHEGIFLIMDTLGRKWSSRFQPEIMHLALLQLKTSPKDVPVASIKAFQFFSRVSSGLYGLPPHLTETETKVIRDPLTFVHSEEDKSLEQNLGTNRYSLAESVVQMLIGEIASVKQIVRFSVRYAMKLYIIDAMTRKEVEELLSSHMPTIKRLVFTRSLRLLPLPEQIGVFDALAFLMHQVPGLIPLSDQHLLAFLSEFLKMSSIADKEMSDTNLNQYVVDKNGFVISAQESDFVPNSSQLSSKTNNVFLRRECVMKSFSDGLYVEIPEELRAGVQLRVSGLRLFRSVIRQHTDTFFGADPSTPVGNIRPHVISLLFRSLISVPSSAVVAAHLALEDILALSTSSQAESSSDPKPLSRLPKELIQTCIRPVLLNLREHTRLSVPLLRGLARLLSLLSSWFNTTLGEKLLEHLQKWTYPERIISRKLWVEGEEPMVAAAILDLFPLLPSASHFVERLVKTTLKLEISLPAYKPRKVVSPYRRPLARYLNKHCQNAISFFFQRLRTPVYSELFQDIVRFGESKPLRDYISSRQCSATLLNVCFERPLGIIRADQAAASKAASEATQGTSTQSVSEILSLHGIKTAPPRKREPGEMLRQDIEFKQKKVQAAQNEASRTKEHLQARLANKVGSAESHKDLDEARNQQKVAQSTLDKALKELNDSKQRYAAEIAKPASESSSSGAEETDGKGNPRPMSPDALELQYQGFQLVETLISNDKNYITDHNDVVKAFRWLWRSKGRYLRLQHAELVPPRFRDESTMLAKFLIYTASAFPNDVDVLLELLRIYLQPTTLDFSFVRDFLIRTVSYSLSSEQKRNLTKKFFAILAGDGKDETKALTIQLIGIPIMSSSVQATKDFDNSEIASATDSKDEALLDEQVLTDFVTRTLMKDGSPATCGDQFKVELLRLSTLLVEHAREEMSPYRKDIIKFSWSLLKSDDSSCKNWAGVSLCRCISVFEMPAKNMLQIYVALLRSYQQEGKELVRFALSILMKVLPDRLSPHDFQKMIDHTIKIMYEEGNSAPQLAHVLHTIVAHVKTFVEYRQRFIRHMINSLNRLGLPPNCPIENRTLSITIVELVVAWDAEQKSESKAVQSPGALVPSPVKKRKEASNEYGDIAMTEATVQKMRKSNGGGGITLTEENAGKGFTLPDENMVESIVSFLLRLRILLADAKLEGNTQMLEDRTTRLLSTVMSRWKHCLIRSLYFEKVVSMCVNETAAQKRTVLGMEKESKDSGTGRGGTTGPTGKGAKGTLSKVESTAASSGKKGDDTKIAVSSSLLLACLDIFIVLVRQAPENAFLKEHSDKVTAILGPCFSRIRQEDCRGIREKLRDFLLPVLASAEHQILDDTAVFKVNVLVEGLMIDTAGSGTISQSAPSSVQKGSRDRQVAEEETSRGRASLAYFAISIIEEASASNARLAETFSTTLMSLAKKLCAKHLEDAASNQRQGGLYPKHGTAKASFRQKRPTPTAAILETAWSPSSIPDVAGSTGKTLVGASGMDRSRQIPAMSTPLRTLVACLRLLSSSSVPLSFSENRASLFKVLNNIMDSSDSVQVVLTVVRIVGEWLLAGKSQGPLTSKERSTFLWKLASFDVNGMPDVSLQPIADLVACIVIDLHRQSTAGKQHHETLIAEPDADDDFSLERALVTCSINANPQIRSDILQLICDSCKVNNSSVTSRDRPPFDILWQLFNSDFSGLGCRLWTTVFVEALLAGCVPPPSTDGHEGCRSWLPCPELKAAFETESRSATPEDYASFCNTITSEKHGMRFEEMVKAVGTIAHGSCAFCQTLLNILLPAAWLRMPDDKHRVALIQSLELLLSQPYHAQFIRGPKLRKSDAALRSSRPSNQKINAIRSLLRALLNTRPLPALDINILAIAADKYSSWYEVLTLLEYQHEVLVGQALNVEGEELKCATFAAIRHGFERLGETRIVLSLEAESCAMPESRRAISFDMYDMVKEAVDSYSGLMDLVETADKALLIPPTDCEMTLWEQRWIYLQREMCQLSVVGDYAASTGDTHLLLESAWKSKDWEKVRTLFSSSPLLTASEDGDPTVKMSEILLAINEGQLNEVESLHVQTAQLCLYKWQLLPALSSGSFAHGSLLHMFHRLVELRESGQIMVESSNHSKRRTVPDLKNLLSAWRHRLPNEFESLSDWDDVFLWRSHMFNAIPSNFHWSEPGTLATLHDRPWTAIRMAKTCRKQNMREVAMLSLQNIEGTMDVSDAFAKLREQILAYDNPESDAERTGGLNLVNTTNLSFFQAPQKSEVFRLKAVFLDSLGARSKSNRAYCHAVQICPSYARAWSSWGGLCASLGRLAERQHEIEASKSEDSESNEEKRAASAKKVAQYLAQAIGCYFEAVQCDTSEKFRVYLPKCLWMLTKDGSSPGILCQTFESRGLPLPSWVWIPWIPQLLTSLYRTEGRAVMGLLSKLGKAYPQALYYSLRAFYLERRDVERSRVLTPATGQHQSSVALAEELMSMLRRSHAALWSSLEAILEELIVKFKPSFDEELLVYISGILERAKLYTDRKSLKKSENNEEDEIVSSISKNVSKISAKFFRTTPQESSPTKRHERVMKTSEFKRKYKEMFESDFQLESGEREENASTQKNTLGLSDLLDRLKKWKNLLEDEISSTPSTLPLIGASPSLAIFACEAPDLWAGSCDPRHTDSRSMDRERSPDPDAGSQSNTSSSYTAATTAVSIAAHTVAKTALSEGNGGDFGGGSAVVEIPGQYFPNKTSSSDARPCPELHGKLVRFESTVRIVRRNDQLVRIIGMVGSDGKTHFFSLQWALPYWTRTEERTSQLFFLLDRVLRRGLLSCRNHLSVQPNSVVPIAQRLRITSEESTRVSLEDAFRLWCEERGTCLDAASNCFQDEFLKRLNDEKKSGLDDAGKQHAEEAARLGAFVKAQTNVPADILLEYMHHKLDGPEQLFQFRKNFCGQLSADAFMQHAFCVVERTPSRTAFLERNGQVLPLDYRFEYNNHGFLHPRKVPFRLTPNIRSAIGELLLKGRFIPCMGVIATACEEARDDLDPALRLLLRDDIIAWYTSKSMAKSDAKMQELEKQLFDRVIRNAVNVQSRIAECAPKGKTSQEEADRTKPVDARVRELVEQATDPKRLCMMPTSFQAWL